MPRSITQPAMILCLLLAALVTAPALAQAKASEGKKQGEGEKEKAQDKAQDKGKGHQDRAGDPYTLDVCVVSSEKLGSMGAPVVKEYEGREVRFCCGGCIKKFEAGKADYWKAIDKAIIEQQKPFFPLSICPVMGEKLLDSGEDAAVDLVVNNRYFRLCCKGCVKKVTKDPAPFLKVVDEAVMRAQRERYPLKACVTCDAEMSASGQASEIVVANRLVRLCCGNCAKSFHGNPAAYLAKLDEAWKAAGGPPAPLAEVPGLEKHDDDDEGADNDDDEGKPEDAGKGKGGGRRSGGGS